MSVSTFLAFPGGRTLTAWWRQLTGYHPDAIWVGYLDFHSIDASVLALRYQQIPPFELLVLKAAASHSAPCNSADLADWLHLDTALIQRVLHHLAAEALVNRHDTASAAITDAGRYAVEHGGYLKPHRERRTLHFWHAPWTSPPSSRFVHLSHPERMPWLAAPEAPFAVEHLRACVRESPEWKRRHNFPAEIRDVLANAAEGWEQVVVATPRRWFAAVIRTRGDHGPSLLGFAVNSRNWELAAAQPAFSVCDEPGGWFPPALSEQAVRQAFAEWCLQRLITAEPTALNIEGNRLIVDGPGEWPDKFRGESWLLAGDGAVRTALRLDMR